MSAYVRTLVWVEISSCTHTRRYHGQEWRWFLWLNLCASCFRASSRCFPCVEGDLVCFAVERCCDLGGLQGLESVGICACSTENRCTSAEPHLRRYSCFGESICPLPPPKTQSCPGGTWALGCFLQQSLRHRDWLRGVGQAGVTFLRCAVQFPPGFIVGVRN